MINLLLCGNKKVFDGALTQLNTGNNKLLHTYHGFIKIKTRICMYNR